MQLYNQEKSHNWEKEESMEQKSGQHLEDFKNARKIKKNLIIIFVLEGSNNGEET